MNAKGPAGGAPPLKQARAAVLEGLRSGQPQAGPMSVHIDITNGCNARCITCWDHSPLLTTPRPAAWKRRRMPMTDFEDLLAQLDALGSVRDVVLSGMGEPLTHPDAYAMIDALRARGWRVTLITNLLAADLDRLVACAPDQLLVGVHGVTPEVYGAFHPGWDEDHFFRLCAGLRALQRAGLRVRHVHAISGPNAGQLVEMVRFGRLFRADRVNLKLASLAGGTEACAVSSEQLAWLRGEGMDQALALAERLGVDTNLDLLAGQLAAGEGDALVTTDMARVGCAMGYVYARVTVDRELLYCCDTELTVGSLAEHSFDELWYGAAWQAWRTRLAAGDLAAGCHRCGKYEQNRAWRARLDKVERP